MASIAIVGTEACGKTVFITTLAMKLGVMDQQGVFLQPKDAKTLKYVEDNWRTLNNREWPPFTRQGELFDLQWTFKAGRGLEFDVRLVDAAGHDLRQLFAVGLTDAEQTTDALKPLARYCTAADVVLFMVNLKDFVGEGNDARRAENQQALLWAMDYLKKNGKHCCVVFTQADQYTDFVKQHGGWREIARTKLNWIYGAHLADDSVPLLTVAAVKDTEVVIENGAPRRVPMPGFASLGFENIIGWIQAAGTNSLSSQQRQRTSYNPPRPTPPPPMQFRSPAAPNPPEMAHPRPTEMRPPVRPSGTPNYAPQVNTNFNASGEIAVTRPQVPVTVVTPKRARKKSTGDMLVAFVVILLGLMAITGFIYFLTNGLGQ